MVAADLEAVNADDVVGVVDEGVEVDDWAAVDVVVVVAAAAVVEEIPFRHAFQVPNVAVVVDVTIGCHRRRLARESVAVATAEPPAHTLLEAAGKLAARVAPIAFRSSPADWVEAEQKNCPVLLVRMVVMRLGP